MLDAYASTGMPLMYSHWSYGKHFLSNQANYQRGQMGLAYEIVINSNPCISYLMEENTMTMQALVIAHACYGHNSFFKGNYLFKTWTDADSIIDYLLFAKRYISECEERYGIDAVEDLLDACHALQSQGVNRYKRPRPLSAEEEKNRQKDREVYIQQTLNAIWSTIPKTFREAKTQEKRFPEHPEENILYFIEKHSPLLETWQREIIRIVRKLGQYFYPQKQTKVMNEGWATFWHYNIMNDLYNEGLITEGAIMEFLKSHTNVVFQPGYDSQYYSGINPYALGFAMFQDIRRICQNPTEEDRQWFPDFAGCDNWLEIVHYAMENFKDESFILQYLSPKVMRDLRLFSITDDDNNPYLEVGAIHNDPGYRQLRETLAAQYNLGNIEPNIQVYDVDVKGDRSMLLRHFMHNRQPLDQRSTQNVVKHVQSLWGFDVKLESVDGDEILATYPQSESDSHKAA
ncbi:spoVR family protein [Elysia marginata]|uniref:SpoVR family protein n=1 Tax=Elysia marginata TaxID=1093978 RepID=A0AAV4GB28_9GAST|nr:spoVR family protein [Elysia marginata]